jgi:hypothetical protein
MDLGKRGTTDGMTGRTVLLETLDRWHPLKVEVPVTVVLIANTDRGTASAELSAAVAREVAAVVVPELGAQVVEVAVVNANLTVSLDPTSRASNLRRSAKEVALTTGVASRTRLKAKWSRLLLKKLLKLTLKLVPHNPPKLRKKNLLLFRPSRSMKSQSSTRWMSGKPSTANARSPSLTSVSRVKVKTILNGRRLLFWRRRKKRRKKRKNLSMFWLNIRSASAVKSSLILKSVSLILVLADRAAVVADAVPVVDLARVVSVGDSAVAIERPAKADTVPHAKEDSVANAGERVVDSVANAAVRAVDSVANVVVRAVDSVANAVVRAEGSVATAGARAVDSAAIAEAKVAVIVEEEDLRAVLMPIGDRLSHWPRKLTMKKISLHLVEEGNCNRGSRWKHLMENNLKEKKRITWVESVAVLE